MKIAIISLGCPKNQVDADVFCHALIKDGHTTVADPAEADIIIINTCAFIPAAREEAFAAIREGAEWKRGGAGRRLRPGASGSSPPPGGGTAICGSWPSAEWCCWRWCW